MSEWEYVEMGGGRVWRRCLILPSRVECSGLQWRVGRMEELQLHRPVFFGVGFGPFKTNAV